MNSFTETIQFIQAFRRMEKGSDKYIHLIIAQLSEQHQHGHLLQAWKNAGKDFADWFINLDPIAQTEIIRVFGLGINDATIDKYRRLRQSDPMAALQLQPPMIVRRYQELVKFFFYNSIDDHPDKKISLPVPAQPGKRYGSSENWGEYILSLNPTQQQFLIEQILHYTRPL